MIVLVIIQTWQKSIFKQNQYYINNHFQKFTIYTQLSSFLQQFIILDQVITLFILIMHYQHQTLSH
jgi:hypothetical protein